MPYPLWALRVRLAETPFALTFGTAGDLGISPDELLADDHGPCRARAKAFRTGGPQAFIAPSAALPGSTNLVVLGPRVLAPWTPLPLDELD
jgi:RES domain